MLHVKKDLLYSLRLLRGNMPFTVGAILSLVLGIGATTAIFSLINGILLKSLPYPEPDRLVVVGDSNSEKGWDFVLSAPANFLNWRTPNDSFVDMTAHYEQIRELPLVAADRPFMTRGINVFGNFFSVLRVQPKLGRGFLVEESWGERSLVVVLSDGLWRRLGADPNIIGENLEIHGTSRTVVGVMPADFNYPYPKLDLWIPTYWQPADREAPWFRAAHNIRVIGRLRAGVSLGSAEAYLNTVASRLESEYPSTNANLRVDLRLLHDWLVGSHRRKILFLMAAVSLVLLISCANVANLLLARGIGRRQELAVRGALGASTGRLVRQLLTENVILALLSGTLGFALGTWAIEIALRLSSGDIPRTTEIHPDVIVFLFAIGISLFTIMIFGLEPAVIGAKDSHTMMSAFRGRGMKSLRLRRLQDSLLVSETALATILLLGSAFFTHSFYLINQVEPGFDPGNILTARVSLPVMDYRDDRAKEVFYEELTKRVRSIPGVESVGATDGIPLLGYQWGSHFTVEGEDNAADTTRVFNRRVASSGYFPTMRVPIIQGRLFGPEDRSATPGVVLVNQSLVRRYFNGMSVVGRRIAYSRHGREETGWLTIIGVVGDERMKGLGHDPQPEVFESYIQDPQWSITLVIRSSLDPEILAESVRKIVRAIDSDLPLAHVASMDTILARSLVTERFLTMVTAIFAITALTLALTGVFAIATFTAGQRYREVAIRMALGATPFGILKVMMSRATRLVIIGFVIGGACGLGLVRIIQSELFQIRIFDSMIWILVTLLVLGTALTASYLPARKVIRESPLNCLRYE
ncbi:MAG: ABC transporter permease [bacterium]|nr:ABC transporter permease [bacterium]